MISFSVLGATGMILAAVPDLEIVAVDVRTLDVVVLSATTAPHVLVTEAVLAASAHPMSSAPVPVNQWMLVDIEFAVPPRVLELCWRPRSLLALWCPQIPHSWPIGHPVADRLFGLLSFPAALLDTACSCNTPFLRSWVSNTSLSLIWLLLCGIGIVLGTYGQTSFQRSEGEFLMIAHRDLRSSLLTPTSTEAGELWQCRDDSPVSAL
jgi:hypothetical protein